MDIDDYLIDLLIDLGFVTAEQVASFRIKADSRNTGIVDLMIAEKVITAAQVTQTKAAQYGIEAIELKNLEITSDAIEAVPAHIAREYSVVPVQKNGSDIVLAIVDPSNLSAIDTLFHLLGQETGLRVASAEDIAYALDKYYPAGATATVSA